MYWFIRLRKSNKVIGSIALINVDFEKGVGEVGKALSPALWGNGYMSEAMNIYLEYCKYNLCLNKIVSNTRSDNYPNIKLMKKIGFKVINELKSYYKDKDGTVHDAIRMSIDL